LRHTSFLAIFICTLFASAADREPWQDFNDYWYQGLAELNRYELNMARYGEMRQGQAVLIFVTEDFLKDKQVKHEFGDQPSQTVLKLNLTRNFNTGLYPYSLMTSVFTAIDFKQPHAMKCTTSVQEWCGHTYLQFNRKSDRKSDRWAVKGHSYFQAEADQSLDLEAATLEDTLWTMIRIDPGKLPTGNLKLVPSSQYLRLRHVKPAIFEAEAALGTAPSPADASKPVQVYHVRYSNLDRELKLFFEAQSPHRIVGWEETYESGFGPGKQKLTTTAVLTHTMMTDYWSKNSNSDSPLREELGLAP